MSLPCWSCRLALPVRSSSWAPIGSRSVATLQKRQPSRKILSSQVAPNSPRTSQPRNNPFGGTNQTEVDPRKLRGAAPGKRTYKDAPVQAAPKSRSRSKSVQPMKALKMQRALSAVSYDQRSQTKQLLEDRGKFNQFGLLPIVAEAIGPSVIRGATDPIPSPIQKLAIPALLGSSKDYRRKAGDDSMQQFLLAAETGSGKTLAYMLPVIDALKRAEKTSKGRQIKEKAVSANDSTVFELSPPAMDEPNPDTGRPRAIILVPTAELVDQVGTTLKALSHTVKYRAALLSASYSGKVIRNRLFSPSGIDVVVSTPHLLSSIVDQDPNVVARVTHLVVDEADSLLDRSFSPTTRNILERATPSLRQLILCSATIPRNLDGFLRKNYPNMYRLTTPNLHAIPRRVQLSVVDVEGDPYHNDKLVGCADTIWTLGRDSVAEDRPGQPVQVIVFVNERETTDKVATFLRGKGIDAYSLNRDASERRTTTTLAEFTGINTKASAEGTPSTSQDMTSASKDVTLKNVKVLVMTDIGSRGIDTLDVKNVILYDVPHTSIDFIHRLGRVGRMGKRGRGFVLVGKGDRRDIVKEVRTGMFMGKALI